MIDDAAEAPGDRREGAPIGRICAGLPAIHETDDAFGEAAAGVGLQRAGVEDGATPALCQDL